VACATRGKIEEDRKIFKYSVKNLKCAEYGKRRENHKKTVLIYSIYTA
jgi:hypothetical protein